jgi:hypothetical protein
VWKLVPSCLMWHIWRERNYRSFENRKRTVVQLKALFFNTLYQRTAALVAFILLAFVIFLILFLFLVRCFSCILPMYLGCTFALFNEIYSFIKKR